MSTEETTYTTEDLLNQTEAATGFRPSVHQLGDWVSAGLLPPSRPGIGRGRHIGGTGPRRWEAECLPRLIIIARSRTGKQVSLHQAAMALAQAGYSPGAYHLRELLSTWLYEWRQTVQHSLTRHRAFLTNPLPPAEKRKRYHASVERRYAEAIDQQLRQFSEAVELVVLGLAPPQDNNAVSQLLFLITEETGTILQECSEHMLEAAYQAANEVLPLAVPGLFLLQPAFQQIGQALVSSVQDDGSRPQLQETIEQMVDGLFQSPEQFIRLLRLPTTLLFLLWVQHRETLLGAIEAAMHQSLSLLGASLQQAVLATMQDVLAQAIPAESSPGVAEMKREQESDPLS